MLGTGLGAVLTGQAGPELCASWVPGLRSCLCQAGVDQELQEAGAQPEGQGAQLQQEMHLLLLLLLLLVAAAGVAAHTPDQQTCVLTETAGLPTAAAVSAANVCTMLILAMLH